MSGKKFQGFNARRSADLGSHFSAGGDVDMQNPVTGRCDMLKLGTGDDRFSRLSKTSFLIDNKTSDKLSVIRKSGNELTRLGFNMGGKTFA